MSKLPLRVAVLGTRGIPDVMGGVETHCQALYPRLAAKGHRITLFARRGYVHNSQSYDFEGVKVVPLWTPRIKSLEAIIHTTIGVFQVFRNRSHFDLLHIHAIGPSLLIPLARFLGLKVVMTHHGPDYDRQKWGRVAKRMLRLGEMLGCRFAHRVICVSRHITHTIENRFRIECAYIPNGVILPELIPSGEKLRGWGLMSRKYILAVGRFVPEKGFHDLVNAFRTVGTDWKLVIAGDADHEDEYCRSLRALAKQDPRIVLTGFVRGRDLAELYSNAGLFVLPSYHEGLPIALLEALSYNLPVLSSDIPANKELVPSECVFPVGNVDVLHDRMEMYITYQAPTNNNSRNIIVSEYNWDDIADKTEALYLNLILP